MAIKEVRNTKPKPLFNEAETRHAPHKNGETALSAVTLESASCAPSALASIPIDDKYKKYLDSLDLSDDEKRMLIGTIQGLVETLLDQKYGLGEAL